MSPEINQFIDMVRNDKEKIENAIKFYDTDSSLLRNIIAEQGIEFTPNQLTETVCLLRRALEFIDNE